MSPLIVYQLPFSLYLRVRPLFAALTYDEPFREAVFEGKYEARVIVDHPDAPTAAMIGHGFEFYLAGAVNTPLRRFLADAPAEAYERYYGYATADDGWKQALIADRPEMLIIERLNFKWPLDRLAPPWRERLPADGTMRAIDADLAERIDRECGEHLIASLDGRANFERYGFGACLLIGAQIASVAYLCGVSDRYANLGIVTLERYRRRGYAMLAASACIEQALARGHQPTWCTDVLNPSGSAALAHKLGFVEDMPFAQVSRWYGDRLTLSSGVWQAQSPRADGVMPWVRG